MAKRQSGFTLIEVLVASAVFALILVLTLQAFGAVAGTTKFSQRRLETLKQVMSAFERVRFDLSDALVTGGLTPYVIKDCDDAGNDALVFIAPAASSSSPQDARKLSIVRYGVESRAHDAPNFTNWPNLPGFAQKIRSFSWSEDLAKVQPWTRSSIDEAFGTKDAQVIAPGIFRFEISFELWNGTVVAQKPDDWKSVRALVLSVAIFDKKAASTLTPQEQQDLAALFPNVNDGVRPSDVWRLSTSRLQTLPLPVRETLHVYEKIVGL